MDKVTISMVAPAFPYCPVWVAEERGFFDRYGITSDIKITGATDKVTTSLSMVRRRSAWSPPKA